MTLLDELRPLAISDDVRALYERCLATFPTAAPVWTRYANAELEAGNAAGVRSVFSRCLVSNLTVELWSRYLAYVKGNSADASAASTAELKGAYDFTLEAIGQDINAGPLWQEYLTFLQAPKAGSPAYEALFASGVMGSDEVLRQSTIRKAREPPL